MSLGAPARKPIAHSPSQPIQVQTAPKRSIRCRIGRIRTWATCALYLVGQNGIRPTFNEKFHQALIPIQSSGLQGKKQTNKEISIGIEQ